MHKKPKVSIITCTYNRPHLLVNAIKSVLGQTMPDFELIVINDGSLDNTREVVKSFNDPRIVYLEKENGGLVSGRNLGIKKAKGKYIGYLDDDDLFYPDHLKVLSRYLDAHSKVGLVYGKAHFNVKGRIFQPYSFCYSRERLELDNFIPSSSLLHKKSCLVKAGLFNKSFNHFDDWQMWLRISDYYKIEYVQRFVSQVSLHNTNMTYSSIIGYDIQYINILRQRLFSSLRKKVPVIPFEGYFMAAMYRLIYKFKADKITAIKFNKSLTRFYPDNPETWLSLSAAYFSYKEYEDAERAGQKALALLPKERSRMNKSQKCCAFNALRLLSVVCKNERNNSTALKALNNSLLFIDKNNQGRNSFSDITTITSRIMNNEDNNTSLKRSWPFTYKK